MRSAWEIKRELIWHGKHPAAAQDYAAKLRKSRLFQRGDEVKTGTRTVKAFGAEITVTVLVHRRKNVRHTQ